MWRASLLEKALMLGKIEGRRRRVRQRMRWLDGIVDSMDMSLRQARGDGEGQGSLVCCSPWSWKVHGLNWATEQQYSFGNFEMLWTIFLVEREIILLIISKETGEGKVRKLVMEESITQWHTKLLNDTWNYTMPQNTSTRMWHLLFPTERIQCMVLFLSIGLLAKWINPGPE